MTTLARLTAGWRLCQTCRQGVSFGHARDTAWAMSQENVDRFLKSLEAFNRGDIEGWLEGFHPDAVFEPRCPDVRDLGDRVLALGMFRTIGRGSGVEQEIPAAFLMTYRDGLCTHFKDYGKWGQALEAVGLSE